jgi:hypothetical protein
MRMPIPSILLVYLFLISSHASAAGFGERLESLGTPEFGSKKADEPPLSVYFVKLSDNPWQLAIAQVVEVNAPLEQLVAALEDVPGYVGIFKDLVKAERLNISGADEFSLLTETSIPIPLISNDKTRMRYRVKRGPGKVIYRFSLEEGNNLKQFEGLAGAVARERGRSAYWEIDLLEPGFGAARMLPSGKFWKESASASVQSDWALKLKAEKPSSPAASILEESEKFADAQDKLVAAAYDTALTWDAFLAITRPAAPSKAASPKSPGGPEASTAKPKHKGPSKEPKP